MSNKKNAANSKTRRKQGIAKQISIGILAVLFLISIFSNESDAAGKNNQSDEIADNIYSISEYPFLDQKKGKKIVELYEKALEADRDEFICVTEEKKFHWFSSSDIWYKKSIDTYKAPYRYYGSVNKDAKPNGMGMLVKNWDESYREYSDLPGWIKLFLEGENDNGQAVEDTYVEMIYIGEFKDGFIEGYGVRMYGDGLYDLPIISYEGEFVHGRMEGKGTSYSGMAGGTYVDQEFQDKMLYEYRVEYSEEADNALLFPTVVKSVMHYEGAFKKGMADGKGKEYYTNVYETLDTKLKYEGEFKKGNYSGSGTLYFEDGTTWYKGKFQNGKFNGKGVLYDEQGKVVHKGKFKNGEVK